MPLAVLPMPAISLAHLEGRAHVLHPKPDVLAFSVLETTSPFASVLLLPVIPLHGAGAALRIERPRAGVTVAICVKHLAVALLDVVRPLAIIVPIIRLEPSTTVSPSSNPVTMIRVISECENAYTFPLTSGDTAGVRAAVAPHVLATACGHVVLKFAPENGSFIFPRVQSLSVHCQTMPIPLIHISEEECEIFHILRRRGIVCLQNGMHERVINVKCTRPGFQRLINIVKRHLDAGRTNAPAFQPAMRSSEQHGAEMK
mmetsp:Transcript_25219/g.81575  ORF Transcript_25219/g.81575 Transcript_25219/m.81575 type:complete len:258 (+) Transcript_25219:4078-4851(+)